MHKLKANLGVIFFKEGEKFIAYSPALDLSSCGDSFAQAKKRFSEVANIFLDETIKMGTLEDVFTDCGWKKVSRPQKHWVPPAIIGQTEQEVKIPV